MSDDEPKFADGEIDLSAVGELPFTQIEYDPEAMKALREKYGPPIADRIRIVVNPLAKSSDVPMLICSKEFAEALGKVVPASDAPPSLCWLRQKT